MKAHKRMKRLRLEKSILLDRADKLNNGPQSSSYSFTILQDDSKKKDPNAPKGPGNVFFLFCRMERDKIQVEKPKENVSEVNKLLALKWKLMTKEQKKVYYDFFKKEMKEYEDSMKYLPKLKLVRQ
ncbi:unnamed protein product [Rhizopus stolonifer]